MVKLMYAIEVNNLTKQYKNGVKALDNLNLTVNSGEIFSLLGPNGAGKSSLINILTTSCHLTSGSIKILSKDLCTNPDWVRTQIACVAQHISIDLHLSLMENMLFQSRLYNVAPDIAKKRITALIDSFNLSEYLKYPTISYSGGVKRRLDIAMTLVSSPKILYLDEPTVGVDINSRKSMWDMLLKIRDEYETTIFLTTHYLEEADSLSDTICIMKEGKELVQNTPAKLRGYTKQNILKIELSHPETIIKYKDELIKEGLIKFGNIRDNQLFVGVSDSKKDFYTVNKWLLDKNIDFNGINIAESTLEDVFLYLTSSNKNVKEGLL